MHTRNQKMNNERGSLMIVLLISIAIIGMIFVFYYTQKLETNKQIKEDADQQKEYIEKQMQDSVKDLQNNLEIPQELPDE